MPTSYLNGLMRLCARPQTNLDSVIRWSTWQAPELPVKGRLQNTLQHTHGIVLLAHLAIARLRPYESIQDPEFLLLAFLVHDHGEGEIGYDTLDPQKTAKSEAFECDAFLAALESHEIDPDLCERIRRAYLLQFVTKTDGQRAELSPAAQAIVAELMETHRGEALLFAALEQLDYVFYAMEAHDAGVDRILREVLERQLPHLERAAQSIPGFREELWTEECSELARAHINGA